MTKAQQFIEYLELEIEERSRELGIYRQDCDFGRLKQTEEILAEFKQIFDKQEEGL